ncbi:hypothetical protein [Pseudooceanicola algae]|uniref:Uncharacterized protein n=1 Tax=Pseudooceanicola algae TaxID=1537215 RepID=A0A418SCF0_9RHOB|nr:hypothetical protein [Pseudooceanicola algae]QPM89993.1 hypothetical protein PSAL_012240 [Pseudooceanicola algae]
MTDTIDFSLDLKGSRLKTVPFRVLDSLDELPDTSGLYVLMGGQPGNSPKALAFGYVPTDLSRHLVQQPEFAAAIREGLSFVAIADPLPGADPHLLVDRLGSIHHAPINALRAAMRDIDDAQLAPGSAFIAPLAAE